MVGTARGGGVWGLLGCGVGQEGSGVSWAPHSGGELRTGWTRPQGSSCQTDRIYLKK